MSKYDDMSDFEINMEVALVLGIFKDCIYPVYIYTDNCRDPVDYCNNPSDAWPIIEANGINIRYLSCPAGSGWVPYAEQDGFHSGYQPTGLRAAMIVFLMMKEAD